MCQLTFCTTVHQNSQFAINYAINIEWISDGICRLLQKSAYKDWAACDFAKQMAGRNTGCHVPDILHGCSRNFCSGGSARYNLPSIVPLRR
jgi:hypothetical protein